MHLLRTPIQSENTYCELGEEEDLSSNRPELVALNECLEEHEDHVDLLYLTNSEVSLLIKQRTIGETP